MTNALACGIDAPLALTSLRPGEVWGAKSGMAVRDRGKEASNERN
jgi:hypothetical protein